MNEDLTIIAASNSFCLAFDVDCTGVTGKKLADLGQGEWNVRQLDSLLRATVAGNAAIDVYEMDLVRAGKETQSLLINAHTLDYFEAESIRVVLAITDVTSQRLADKVRDDLVREKQLLLHEIQHRVANSPSDHRQRAAAKRAKGAVERNARAFARRAQPRNVYRDVAKASVIDSHRRCRPQILFQGFVRKHWRIDDWRPRTFGPNHRSR